MESEKQAIEDQKSHQKIQKVEISSRPIAIEMSAQEPNDQ